MTDKTGGPAFPLTEEMANFAKLSPNSPSLGMTLRDYFAAKMLEGDTANSHEDGGTWPNGAQDAALLQRAQLYYRMADAMLKARNLPAAGITAESGKTKCEFSETIATRFGTAGIHYSETGTFEPSGKPEVIIKNCTIPGGMPMEHLDGVSAAARQGQEALVLYVVKHFDIPASCGKAWAGGYANLLG
jgi:hypothetical protein